MSDEQIKQATLDAMLVEMIAITDYLIEKCCESEEGTIQIRQCPKCSGDSVEIYTIEQPIGYTGIYRCMECDATFDPNMPELN